MNVLVYVLVMITAMLLSVTMRMPSTVTGAEMQKAYDTRMREVEVDQLSRAVEKVYDQNTTKKEDGDEEEEKEKKGSALNRKLSMVKVVKNRDSWERRVFYDLLEVLLGGQEWYEEAVGGRPYYVDELLDELALGWDEKKPKDLRNIGEMKLLDEGKQLFLKRALSNGLLDAQGKSNLLDTQGSGNAVSLYLAYRPLLLAIFGKPEVVEELMEVRQRIYKELSKKKGEELKEAKESSRSELERLFGPYLRDPSGVTFRVSKTQPPKK